MPLTIECPSCKWKGRAPDAALGKKVRCPSCKSEFTAEAPPSAPPLDDMEVVDEPAAAEERITNKAEADRRDEDDEDRPRKKRRDRDDDDDEEDEDRPQKKKRRYHDEDDEDDDDDDRPRKKRRDRDDDEDDEDDEDRPRKKRRGRDDDDDDDEDDDDDRPRKKRRDREDDEDDEDDDDRPRKKKKRRGRDDDDDDDGDRKKRSKKSRQKEALKRLRLANLLNFIGACIYAGALALALILWLIGWVAAISYNIFAIPALAGLGGFIVSAVGFVFGMLGPSAKNAKGLGIATLAVGGAHLLFALMTLGLGYQEMFLQTSSIGWNATITNIPVFTWLTAGLTYGAIFLPLLTALLEPARIIVYAMWMRVQAAIAGQHELGDRFKHLMIGTGIIAGSLMLLAIIMGIVLRNTTFTGYSSIRAIMVMIYLFPMGGMLGVAIWLSLLLQRVRKEI